MFNCCFYDELSDHGYNSLPKRYQKSDALQVQICCLVARCQTVRKVRSNDVNHMIAANLFLGLEPLSLMAQMWVLKMVSPLYLQCLKDLS